MRVSLILVFFTSIFWTIECEDNFIIKDQANASTFIANINNVLVKEIKKMTEANWGYEVDISPKTTKQKVGVIYKILFHKQFDPRFKCLQLSTVKAYNKFLKELSSKAKKYDWTNFSERNQRLLEKMSVIGTAALNEEDDNKV